MTASSKKPGAVSVPEVDGAPKRASNRSLSGGRLGRLVKALTPGGPPARLSLSGEGPIGYVLARLGRGLGRPIVVVCSSGVQAEAIARSLELFSPGALRLPAPDVSAFLPIGPNPAALSERLAALSRLVEPVPPAFVVTDPVALARHTLSPASLRRRTGRLNVGDDIDRDALLQGLDLGGYARVPVVEDPGTYAVRGGIVDLYPPGLPQPLRIDFFGDSVEAIRTFDPESQRTTPGSGVKQIVVPPCREVLLTPDGMRLARDRLRVQAGECGVVGAAVRSLLEDLDAGIRPLGLENWLPAFEDSVPGAVYLPEGAAIVVVEPAAVQRATTELFAVAEVEFADAVRERRIVFPVATVLTPPVLDAGLTIEAVPFDDDPTEKVELALPGHDALREAVQGRRGDDRIFEPVAARIAAWRRAGHVVVALAASPGHQSRLEGIAGHYAIRTRSLDGAVPTETSPALAGEPIDLFIAPGGVEEGFEATEAGVILLGTNDVVPHQRRFDRPSRRKSTGGVREALLQSFRDLDPGSLVVHQDYGIGRYDGLHRMSVEGVSGDFLKLGYQGGSTLYVPVHRLDRVQRYSAGEEAVPPLDKLGGVAWEKTRTKAKKAAENMARELVRVQAARKSRERPVFSPRDAYVDDFEAAFPYDETPDQSQAIADVMADLENSWPMDRLICGDVGYGKTEVAIRAAFRVVYERKQVAVLVPTTVLAEQHGRSFETRFLGYPVTVAVLSRFRSGAEERDILERLRAGKIDIVIGTHRLLSNDVVFRDLGLLVIDEEHRFGVKHKERMKQLKELVDVLTLSATPIPRTLNMAISGLRDMSVIATPPGERLAVRTLVSRTSDDVIRDAISQELARGGQVYFVHNQVETIGVIADRVQRLVPRARILVGHGQMDEALLERVMLAFIGGEADVLVCTTIVESGLDVPTANTIVLNRADKLGLAQLYQLRGRVGRSNVRAYCYLLVPAPDALDDTARKRIEAMQKHQDLGSGFAIASLDMEIRGAGNLLGKAQSGHVKDVGLEMFSELLGEAVAELEGTASAEKAVSCELKVALSAFLPDDYVPDINLRLWFYKRIASAKDAADLEDAISDLADRAGRLPPEAARLRDLAMLKLECQALGVTSLGYAPVSGGVGTMPASTAGVISFTFAPSSPMAGPLAYEIVSRRESRWRLTPTELVRPVSALEWSRELEPVWDAVRELGRLVAKRAEPRPAGR